MNRVSMTAAMALALAAGAAMGQITGPSSSQTPFLLPTSGGTSPAPGAVRTVSIFTTGDSIGGYRMAGIPDGLGAFSNGDGTMSLLMNHEIGGTAGSVRSHGSTGAFVSRWNINADVNNLTVNSGRDHLTSSAGLNLWNGTSYASGTTQFTRFCSGDLAPQSAYSFGGLGTTNRIFMNGEESGAEGRAFAHVATGADANTTWQLPKLGRFSWENSVASPKAQAKTIVMGNDDSTPGQAYMYVGNKTDSGNDIQRAGLTNGNLYGIAVQGLTTETRTAGVSGRFVTANLGDVSSLSGAELQVASTNAGVTEFLRPEDGAWDARPGFENDFYFVTTDRVNTTSQVGASRLYRLRFDDISNPEAGGSVTMLLDGRTSGFQMLDNLCVDKFGRILMQEDVGNNAHLGKMWLYDTASQGLALIAQHDPARFLSGSADFQTVDEESSGVMDASDLLGDGWYLLDVQNHKSLGGELVESGQLLAMYVDPSVIPAPSSMGLLGLAALVAGRRRR